MTTKDLRDIAAYLGCPFHYAGAIKPWETPEILTPETLCNLQYASFVSEYAGVQLHLRPISSLTDEELKTCYLIVYPEFKSVESIPIYRELGAFSVGVLQISQYREYLFADTTFGIEPIDNPGAVIAYLQFIGVYIPGTINSDYVQLIEP